MQQLFFKLSEEPLAEIVAIYINERKLAKRISNMFMVGLQFEADVNKTELVLTEVDVAGLIVNNSMFFEINSHLLVIQL